MKKILVTGAGGVLGRKLIQALKKKSNYYVCAATSDNVLLLNQFTDLPCVSYQEVFHTEFLQDFDLIVNCAFPRYNDMAVLANALSWYDTLLDVAVRSNVYAFINISSQSVYGNYRECFVTEEGNIFPQDIYAFTKYACEIIGRRYLAFSKIKITNLRLASLIGIEYPERVINKMIVNAKNSNNIYVNNDKNAFGYMDVEDAVSGIMAFIEHSQCSDWNFCYNVGISQQEFKNFGETAEIIASLFVDTGLAKQVHIEKKDKADKLCFMSSEKFYAVSKWKPSYRLEDSIKKIFYDIVR